MLQSRSEAARGKSVQTQGSKSDKAKLKRTCGKDRYQARASEPIGEEGGVRAGCWGSIAGEKEELALMRSIGGQSDEQRMCGRVVGRGWRTQRVVRRGVAEMAYDRQEGKDLAGAEVPQPRKHSHRHENLKSFFGFWFLKWKRKNAIKSLCRVAVIFVRFWPKLECTVKH
jgi:hypothetical protein